MTNPGAPEVLASIAPSPVRVWLGLFVNMALLLIVIAVLLAAPPSNPVWTGLLAALAVYLGWGIWRGWDDRGVHVLLTTDAILDSAGREICRLDNIRQVDRGIFALKPARGIALELNAALPGAWRPGLWWRIGRRVGIGGVTSAGAARLMAEMIDGMIASRRG